MSKILVDTCVWIEFFNKKSRLSEDKIKQLSEWIKEEFVSTLEPIRAELLSGLRTNDLDLERCLDSLEYRDLHWENREVWNRLVEIAKLAKKKNLPVLGLIDRMILLAALESGDQIWSLDQSLMKLAKGLGLNLIPA